eukprot:gene21302-1190_t
MDVLASPVGVSGMKGNDELDVEVSIIHKSLERMVKKLRKQMRMLKIDRDYLQRERETFLLEKKAFIRMYNINMQKNMPETYAAETQYNAIARSMAL